MAAEKSPAFQFYPKDFLMDGNVAEMSLQERGAYITLLCVCWQEQSLSTDPRRLANVVGLSYRVFSKCWPAVAKCFREQDGRLIHPRLEKERTKQADHRQRQSDKGRAGAEARWLRLSSGHAPAIAQAIPEHSSPISDLQYKKKQPSVVGRPKAPPDPRVKEFLAWFQSEYTTRREGAVYLVKWGKHGALVKAMLHATPIERLQKFAQIMLSEKCEDDFIVASDRGIEVLSAKFSWLSDRLAAWEARRRA